MGIVEKCENGIVYTSRVIPAIAVGRDSIRWDIMKFLGMESQPIEMGSLFGAAYIFKMYFLKNYGYSYIMYSVRLYPHGGSI